MIKRIGMIALILVVMMITGCVDTHTIISVRKDGSGILTQKILSDPTLKNMFTGVAEQVGGEPEDIEDDLLNNKKYQEKASRMGEGVRFVSVRKVSNKKGLTGVEVVYAFDNIEKINMNVFPDSPMIDGMTETMDADIQDTGPGNGIYFEFFRGNPATLIIRMPARDESEFNDEYEDEQDEDMEDWFEGMDMMKMFMENLRIRKSFRDKRPRTTLSITQKGISAFSDYLKALQSILPGE
ncbi:MAG TPA: hypothetical protein ENN03_10255 [bacterium]|nr:hypothetical protein [bacterium]